MKNIREFMEWAASHATLRELGGTLFVDRSIIGTDPWQYLFGTTGRASTESLLNAKYNQYYKGWGWSRKDYDLITSGWAKRGQMVCDCQGLEDCFSGKDTNAKGNYKVYCNNKYKGLISKINRPYVFGEALFCGSTAASINHVGWVVGLMPDGEPIIVHERGLKDGCVIERMSKSGKKWTYRGLMDKRYVYDKVADTPTSDITTADKYEFTHVLKYGCKYPEDVKQLKQLLVAAGYKGLTVTNGNYFSSTKAKVKTFQKDNGLDADGIAGKQTITALGGIWKG